MYFGKGEGEPPITPDEVVRTLWELLQDIKTSENFESRGGEIAIMHLQTAYMWFEDYSDI